MIASSESAKRIDFGDGVWGEIIRDFDNPLVKRRELTIVIHHVGKPTPMRINLRLAVSEKFGVPVQNVYVRNIKTEYGIGRSTAIVHIYESVDRAKLFEPEYVIERNGGVNPFEEEE